MIDKINNKIIFFIKYLLAIYDKININLFTNSGKQAIVEQLEQEVREAEAVVQEESASLQQCQANVNAAIQAAQQANTQLKTLTGAVQMAQANVGNSEQAAQGAQQQLTEKTQLMEAAKNRVEQLLRQLSSARADYANTKTAAYKASAAAHEAKVNAARNRRRVRVQPSGEDEGRPKPKESDTIIISNLEE